MLGLLSKPEGPAMINPRNAPKTTPLLKTETKVIKNKGLDKSSKDLPSKETFPLRAEYAVHGC